MHESEAGILRIECRGDRLTILHLSCGSIAREVQPGQFVQVRVSDGSDPFLRRTFSVYDADVERGTFSLMVDMIGPGTEKLCRQNRTRTVSVIGPLGRSFDFREVADAPVWYVAGGVGAAPLLFLAHTLQGRGSSGHTMFFGARDRLTHALYDHLFGDVPRVLFSSDDGSVGYHGFVSELLEKELQHERPAVMYVCGPHPMMKAVAAIALRNDIPCQVSLEERMACGIGACYGCAVPLVDGRMVRSCVDGPVFDAREVAW